MLLELVHTNTMNIAVVENMNGIIPYKVTFNNFLPGQASESYLFYPEGYLKDKFDNPLYPDDAPEDIKNQSIYNSNNYTFSNYYDGEYIVIYCINENWYYFKYIIFNGELISINDSEVNFDSNNKIWFDKIENSISGKILISYKNDLFSNLRIGNIYNSIQSKVIITRTNDLLTKIDVAPTSNIKSNVIIRNTENVYCNITVTNSYDLKSSIIVTTYKKLQSNIKILLFNNLFSNIQITKFNEINSNINIKYHDDLQHSVEIIPCSNINSNLNITYKNQISSKIKINYFSNLFSNVNINYVNDLQSKITIIKANNINSKIKVLHKKSVNSKIIITHTSFIRNIINITHFKDLKTNIFTRFREFRYIPSNVLITNTNEIESSIIISKVASQILSSLDVKPWVNNDMHSELFIIGLGYSPLKSKTIVTNKVSIPSNMIVIKYVGIKSSINIIPKYFSAINMNVNVNKKVDLYSKLFINPHNNVNAKASITKYNSKNLYSFVKIRSDIEVKDIIGKITIKPNNSFNVINNYVGYKQFDLLSNINIFGKNILPSNINIIPIETLNASICFKKNDNNNIYSNIKISSKDELYSILNISSGDSITAKSNILNVSNDGIISKINITTKGEKNIYSKLIINPHTIAKSNVNIYSSHSSNIYSIINIKRKSEIISNIFVQPNSIIDSNSAITSRISCNISSKVLVTYNSQITSNILINSNNIISGEVGIIGNTVDLTTNIKIRNQNSCNINSLIKIEKKFIILGNVRIDNAYSQLNSEIIIVSNDSLQSSLFVRCYSNINKFKANINIEPLGLKQVASNVNIMYTTDINSTVLVNESNNVSFIVNAATGNVKTVISKVVVKYGNSLYSNIKIICKASLGFITELHPPLTSNKFNPYKDSFTYEKSILTNYGNASNLYFGNTLNGRMYTFIAFDISSINKTTKIYKAELIFTNSDLNILSNINLYETKNNWDENSITWKTNPSILQWITSISSTPTTSRFSFDITNYIKGAIINNIVKPSFMISQSPNTIGVAKKVSSREGTDSPILYITYVTDLQYKYSSSVLKSNIGIKGYKDNNLKSKIIINRYNDKKDIKSNAFIRLPGSILSSIDVVGSTLKSNIVIPSKSNNSLISSININISDSSDISSTIDIKGSTILSNIIIRLHDKYDLYSNIGIQQFDKFDMTSSIDIKNSTILANINISNTDYLVLNSIINVKAEDINNLYSKIVISKQIVPTKVVITWRNTKISKVVIRRNENNDLQSKLYITVKTIVSNVIITTKDSRMSNIIIRTVGDSNIESNIYIQPVGHKDIMSLLAIRHDHTVSTKLTITRPKINSNIIIRRTEFVDLPSTLKVYVFEGYIFIM